MNRKVINLIVLSDKNGIRNYVITYKKFISYAFLFFSLFVLFVAFFTYLRISLSISKDDYEKMQRNVIKEKVTMANEMGTMRRYLEKIGFMIEDDVLSSELTQANQYGIGGGEENTITAGVIYEDKSGTFNEDKDIEKTLFEEIDDLENDLKIVVESLLNKEEKLNSTPSIFPVKGIVTSGFGYRTSPFTGRKELHRGIDILNKEGTHIISPANGVVKKVTTNSLWGLNITISHGYNVETQYGHLLEAAVKPGQQIKRGDPIGKLGKSGRSTGPHLHYQIWVKGEPVDPMGYIIQEGH